MYLYIQSITVTSGIGYMGPYHQTLNKEAQSTLLYLAYR